jgi:regulatory protein
VRPPRPKPTIAERREAKAGVDDPAVVLEAAARFLEARSRSVAEVRRRLGRAGYRSELVEDAIRRLTELGILDDEAFGRAWVESRDRARPRGEMALRRELGLKGVERGVVDELLATRRDQAAAISTSDGGAGEHPDLAAARRVVARHARALERVADLRARRQRAYGLLARSGFDASTCASISAEVVRMTEAAADDDDAVIEPEMP